MAVTLLLQGCFGVPDDAIVEKLTIKAWGGILSSCQEMQVNMLDETVAQGRCDQVGTAGADPIDPAVIDQIGAGISESEFSPRNVNPPPGCGSCPTRMYTLLMSSASKGESTEGRIVPSESLLASLEPLSPP